jgi:hypothetical protein
MLKFVFYKLILNLSIVNEECATNKCQIRNLFFFLLNAQFFTFVLVQRFLKSYLRKEIRATFFVAMVVTIVQLHIF